MAQVTTTAAQIAVMFPEKAEIYDRIAAEALTAGELCYLDTNGKATKATAAAAGTVVDVGLVLTTRGAGGAVSVLKRGHVAGATLTSLDYGAAVYVSDDAGDLADAAGTVSKIAGRVEAIAQADGPVKCLYIDQAWS